MKLLKYPQDKTLLHQVVCRAEYAGLLVPNPREEWIQNAVDTAKEFGFASVHATPYIAASLAKKLEGSGVDVLCNIGMMTGLELPSHLRVRMCAEMFSSGVKKIDLGMDRGWIDDKKYDAIREELRSVAELARAYGGQLGASIEAGSLRDEQKLELAQVAVDAGADYLRICSGTDLLSGINNGRASLYEVCLIQDRFGGQIKIKAGGGWDYAYAEDCLEQLQCGADCVDVGDRFVDQLRAIGYGREDG